jgi:3' exoribonuclease, RNase T-like
LKYFIDTEFYEDGKTIDLISIGVVADDGRELYAVSREAELHKVSPWVRENVLPSLPTYGDPAWMTREEIKRRLTEFVSDNEKPVFYGYYADYDWICICQLFGTMMQLPWFFPKFCMDLKQLSVSVGSPQHPPEPVVAHNALVDARWNRDLFKFLIDHQTRKMG